MYNNCTIIGKCGQKLSLTPDYSEKLDKLSGTVVIKKIMSPCSI
jgi:hypothetical protein